MWPSFDTEHRLADGTGWTATFERHDGKVVLYRVSLFEYGHAIGDVVVRLGADLDTLEAELARAAVEHSRQPSRFETRTLVVDDVSYRWSIVEDDIDYMKMSNRGLSGDDIVQVRGDDGFSITFDIPLRKSDAPGWWRGTYVVTSLVVERAIRRARQRGMTSGKLDELRPLFDGEHRTLQRELDAASRALASLCTAADAAAFIDAAAAFARAMLAIGCATTDRAPTDDWVASHANELVAARPQLQRLLTLSSHAETLARHRSAIAFLLDLCARVDVDLALDTARVDAALQIAPASKRPWGIPAMHWWWRD